MASHSKPKYLLQKEDPEIPQIFHCKCSKCMSTQTTCGCLGWDGTGLGQRSHRVLIYEESGSKTQI